MLLSKRFNILIFTVLSGLFSQTGFCQGNATATLTIDQIMQGTAFTGTSPSNISWSENGRQIYFQWNPDNNRRDSLYTVNADGKNIRKVTASASQLLPTSNGAYNRNYTQKVYEKNGDIYLLDVKSGKIEQLTNTVEREYLPDFTFDQKKIAFLQNNNLFYLHLGSGQLVQLTDFRKGPKPTDPEAPKSEQEKWLRSQQPALLNIVKLREADKATAKAQVKANTRNRPLTIYLGDKAVDNIVLSPDEQYITYRLSASVAANTQIAQVPNFVTGSGFTQNIATRPKVGHPQPAYEMAVYNRHQDTTYQVPFTDLPGINEVPAFRKDYATKKENTPKPRAIIAYGPVWSDNGKNALLVARAQDNKDRWLLSFEPTTRTTKLLYRQHDEAWINGPGIGYGAGEIGWLPDNEHIWFQSEETGYSHLYTVNIKTGAKKALTHGNYEISNLQLSRNKKYWYFNANKNHPGDVQFYRLPLQGGEAIALTSLPGSHEVTLSPDEKTLAIRYSYSNKPWELYLQDNRPGAKPKQVTNSLPPAFKAYNWREPEVLSFKAADGVNIFARLYRPAQTVAKGPAVIFVHGAGYLQNAHKWWSQYFREYMFHNFLVDQGYTVLDIDYRGSSGYGRDVRTGIYRHMGGKDLSDHVDGAKLLVDKYGVDAKRIGIYGGSYGGFITLMAMFTQPDVFAAGAALRSVTDWAHYNHGYTANILNEPFTDSLAYVKSSPIYFAEGLKGALLMCHGMVDTNVHFQDIVRLSQRLIELKKENWELAVYPVEDHAFTEPSSWADEYKRIFKLFETNLKPAVKP
ncbi:prolyl oligopeptidase family serine peptidase [Adhaeribacter rhizoryzae]|uniref:Prolyl oligopeptidase family serine peptidase n=1 Tax=Adhaeribacter rhizoryzae TaxID=2607907 RepID=A0A5M6CZQ0_9BACT|nr:prolyl oligopeptidase family serine peptidase [Adhaeribacter rhizoryzae]KAA5540336.1 prolyl oligopeptidase family serine peptidase [Adhaeribacter rhizoryzae]